MSYSNSDRSEDEKVLMLNGRSVMNALTFLNSAVTENQLLQCLTASNDEPRNIVKQELKRILDDAVTNGFITRNGGKYAIPGMEKLYQTDCASSDDDEPFEGFAPTEVASARRTVVKAWVATGAMPSSKVATKRGHSSSGNGCSTTAASAGSATSTGSAASAGPSKTVTVTVTATYVLYFLFRLDRKFNN